MPNQKGYTWHLWFNISERSCARAEEPDSSNHPAVIDFKCWCTRVLTGWREIFLQSYIRLGDICFSFLKEGLLKFCLATAFTECVAVTVDDMLFQTRLLATASKNTMATMLPAAQATPHTSCDVPFPSVLVDRASETRSRIRYPFAVLEGTVNQRKIQTFAMQ